MLFCPLNKGSEIEYVYDVYINGTCLQIMFMTSFLWLRRVSRLVFHCFRSRSWARKQLMAMGSGTFLGYTIGFTILMLMLTAIGIWGSFQPDFDGWKVGIFVRSPQISMDLWSF